MFTAKQMFLRVIYNPNSFFFFDEIFPLFDFHEHILQLLTDFEL